MIKPHHKSPRHGLTKRHVSILIPARLQSQRLHEKMLIAIDGIPLVVRTYRQALLSRLADEVLIVCDHRKILNAAQNFGCRAILSPPSLKSGSDRIAYAVKTLALKTDIIVNLQGDEPFISPRAIDALISPMITSPKIPDCATLITPITSSEKALYDDPNTVKCVITKEGYALYFSRSPLPFYRDGNMTKAFRHIGIYAYRRDTLLRFTSLRASALEQAEKLEQLRLLENGISILTVKTRYQSLSIDTAEDLVRASELMARSSQKNS